MDIGRRLKYYRDLHNLTQSEVAERSGINEKYLGRIERNESVPTINKVEQLCVAFDIRLSDMLMNLPERVTVSAPDSSEQSISITPKIVYYCNCCGCAFQSAVFNSVSDDIRCPECSCLFDSENGYIEKTIAY